MDIDLFSVTQRENDTEFKARILSAVEKNLGPAALEALVLELAFAKGSRVDQIGTRFHLVRVEPVIIVHY